MSFDDIQTGPKGRTVELYEFSQSGEFTRVTSASVSQFISAIEYVASPGLSRSKPVQGNEDSSGDIKIVVPDDFIVAQQFRGQVPSSFPSLTIFKKHLNDPDDALFTYWKGDIVNCAFDDRNRQATLFGRTALRVFERPIPRAVYSGLCNNQLFDGGCRVVRASFSGNLVVSAVDTAGVTLTIPGLRDLAVNLNTAAGGTLTDQELDDYWQRGIVSTNVSPSEFRMVVETDVSGDPNSVRVTLPFRESVVGVSVNITAGCPHSVDFCDRKFLNAENFGGFPFVPGENNNPFAVELDSGRSITNAPLRRTVGAPR